MRKPKKISLTIRQTYNYDFKPRKITKIWEKFSYGAYYWFKHRADGPAWIDEGAEIWMDNGRMIKRVDK